ncbi:MAG: amidohydrolase [Schleiferiaceae bacterium]|nr:amidohydrolase [Schleiferiaceae bacterium]
MLIALIISVLYGCETSEKTEEIQLYINTKIINQGVTSFSEKGLYVDKGRIVGQGLREKKLTAKDSITEGFVYPGFIDAHCHFWGYATVNNWVDLVGTKSFDEVLDRVQEYHQKNQSLVILGRGWDQNDWDNKDFPINERLNELFPDVSVMLTRVDGHAMLVNDVVLKMNGITESSFIEGGEVVLKNGKPTGLLIDNAKSLVHTKVSNNQMIQDLLTAQQNCLAVGLTTLDDAGLDYQQINVIDSLQREGDLLLRFYIMASDNDENMAYYSKNGPLKTDRLNVRSFKLYADGALGSRGALLKEEYSDHHGHGLQLSSKEHFRKRAEQLYDMGFQMNTHAIGDSANKLLLSIYKEVLGGKNDKRWRIEHAQVVDKYDFSLFEEYSVLPSVQPTHATSDMYWADERLGNKRIKGAYAYKQLLETNGVLPLGTDFPVEDINPLKTFYAAVLRKDVSGYPEDGFQMENALTRSEALKGMTIWAAYSNFEEDEKGSIEEGKLADFTVLDTDLLNCSPEEILNAKVLYTVINGEIVYRAENH